MTLIEKFKAADKKVNELESTLEYDCSNYIPVKIFTKEYEEALSYAQELYKELKKQGINPF